ncbi:hypothetical protein [Streptomyces sp. NPDC091371]|uniref:hypothetical protein n=1 Tax=Streptomyces sp. NPDC091371 TaxID=3155303 RepID=UPI0034492389
MARRNNMSCAGIGCMGHLLLNLVAMVGAVLAFPVVIPDVMAEQTPPLEVTGFEQWAVVYGVPVVVAFVLVAVAGRGGRFVWWLFLIRGAVLLAAVALAVRYVDGRVAGEAWNLRAAAVSSTAGLVALAVYLGVRWWDRSQGARPVPGEVWLAMVPLREDPKQELRHYCVVLATGRGFAEVAQITSKDKDGRRDHIRIPNDGWDEVSGRPHWVEIGREPRTVRYRGFLRSRPQGRCPDAVFAQLQARRPAGPSPAAGSGPGRGGAPNAARGAARAASRGGLWAKATRYLR